MKEYLKDKYFMSLIQAEDKLSIKREIPNMLFKYRGNKEKIDELIKYSKDNGLFEWDIHDGKDIPSHFEKVEERYNYEKEILKRNFSKIRYERVLKLLKLFLKERGIDTKVAKAKVEKKEMQPEFKSIKKKKVNKSKFSSQNSPYSKKKLTIGVLVGVVAGAIIIPRTTAAIVGIGIVGLLIKAKKNSQN